MSTLDYSGFFSSHNFTRNKKISKSDSDSSDDSGVYISQNKDDIGDRDTVNLSGSPRSSNSSWEDLGVDNNRDADNQDGMTGYFSGSSCCSGDVSEASQGDEEHTQEAKLSDSVLGYGSVVNPDDSSDNKSKKVSAGASGLTFFSDISQGQGPHRDKPKVGCCDRVLSFFYSYYNYVLDSMDSMEEAMGKSG